MYYITVIIIPFVSIIIGYLTAVKLNIVSLICSVIILLINVDMFYLYDNLINLFSEKYENNIIEQQNKAYLNQLHLMQESQMKIRFLKHDMKNHIINMQSLLSAEKYDQLKDYLAETNDYIYSNNVIIDSGNETIDSVLNYKLAPLENNSVEKSYHVVLPEQILISSFDLNIVICNLIDNALEALSLLGENDEKKITIDIVYKQGYIKILVGNSFDGIIHKDKRTRKNDEINHGIGLKSVQNIAEKYGGILKTDVADNWFETSVIMYEKWRCKKKRNKARGFPRYGSPRALIYHTAKKNYLILKKGYSKHSGRNTALFADY